MLKNRWGQWTAIAATVVVLVVALRTCGSSSDLANRDPGQKIDAELTLQTVTLEQPDEDGKLLWRLKAESVIYSPDNQRAELQGLKGEFFQENKTIYTVVADEGEVQQNGETLLLRGNLVATGTENKLTLRGEKLKWQPKQDLLMMGNFEDDVPMIGLDGKPAKAPTTPQANSQANSQANLPTDSHPKAPVVGSNPQLEAVAQVVKVYNQENRVELSGAVTAKSKATPWLAFQSENLLWFTERQLIEAKQPIKVEQYQSKDYKTVSDRLTGQTGQVQLDKNIVTLKQAVQLDSLTQPLKVNSESAVWDVSAQTVALDQPVNIEQPARKIKASADKASLNLAQKVIYLIGNVKANGEENDARLAADQVTWQTETDEIDAEGNVSYQQAANPEVSMSGSKAVGNIEQGTVVVTGGEAGTGEVVTTIVPGDS